MKKLSLALLVLLFQITSNTEAADISGYTLPDTISRFNKSYSLSGCGLREMLFSDIYLLGLYLETPTADPATIRNSGRIFLLKVLYKGDLPEDLPALWSEPLARQLSSEYLDILQDIYDKVDNGDSVEISFEPGEREIVRINDTIEIRETEIALMPALTNLWLGEEPVSGNLKRLLLKVECN